MQRLIQTKQHEVWFDRLERPFEFASPFQDDDFVLMLVTNDITITHEEQARLSESIVRQGCRYAVCTGHKCSSWDDSIDLAFICSSPDYSPSDDRFVMTSWHEHDSLAEVVFFFRNCTCFDDFIAQNFLVVFLGTNNPAERRVIRAIQFLFGETS